MKKLLPLILSLLFALTLSAQVVQKGIAVEYNEKAAKTALAGVEFRVQRAGSTASDAKGAFELDFPTLKAGDRVAVRRIEKPGYEVFNKEAVEQWNINPSRAFTVVMCRSDKFKALKDRYYSNSEERYAGQYRSAKAELERLKKEGKLKEQEYYDRLRDVEAEYEKKLDNLDNYVDRFARIDLSELNAEEQEIIDLVQSGQIDEAIERYEKMNYLGKALKEISDIKEIDNAVNSLNELREGKTSDRDAYLAGVERTINTMLLAGDSKNNATIAEMYTTIADADTTNVEWLNKTGVFIHRFIGNVAEALRYYQTALCILEKQELKNYSEIIDTYNNIGNCYYSNGELYEAYNYHSEAKELSIVYLDGSNELKADSYNNMGNDLAAMEYYREALDCYKEAELIYEELFDSKHPYIATVNSNMGVVYSYVDDFDNALKCYQKSLEIREKTIGKDHPDTGVTYYNLGSLYCKAGKFNEALEYCNRAIEIWKKTIGSSHPDMGNGYSSLGCIYEGLEDYPTALECYQNALDIFIRLYGPNHYKVDSRKDDIKAIKEKLETRNNGR